MPINHFSSDFQGTLLWTQHPPPNPIMQNHLPSHHHNNNPNPTWISLHHHPKSSMSAAPSLSFNLNLSHDTADSDPFHHPKQPMFEKPLTPSDVGKLNRLVIPKQYAEKYFPLGATGDSSDKGLLLSFEDESGKLWRFRYSYWNSSQSYVLTKGWSRYVKEKRLDAGDVVVFERHRLDGERLFIGWKRRSPAAAATATTLQDGGSPGAVAASTSGGGWTRMFYSAHPYPSAQQSHQHLPSPPYQSDCPHAESSVQSQTVSAGNSKILRLFGVNLECQTDDSEPEPPSTPSGRSGLTSQDPTHHQFYPHYSSPLPHHMDFTFPQDVKQTKYHRG